MAHHIPSGSHAVRSRSQPSANMSFLATTSCSAALQAVASADRSRARGALAARPSAAAMRVRPRRGRARASASATEVDPADVYAIQSARDDGEEVVNAKAWLEARASDAPVAGVYATYDADGAMTFVGYRRDVLAAVRAHVERNGADATGVRVAAFANKAMATRANLRAESDRWIGEWVEANGGEEASIPKGNLAVNAADWTLVSESWPNEGAATVAGAGAAGTPTVDPNTGDIVSPYAAGGDAVGSAEEEEEPLDPNRELKELTVANVDEALNEVRPYLQADGGDVEVVGIEDGIVAVRMQGACGSCSSSTATLKGGIEKTLVKVFGDAVTQVVNLDDAGGGGAISLSREAVAEHLEKLSGAIHNYGGSAAVTEVEDGVCVLEFKGPLALGQSIASSLKGKFPLLKEVKIKQIE